MRTLPWWLPWLFLSASALAAESDLTFGYQQNEEPWASVSCEKAPSDDGNPYDWEVSCPFRGTIKRYQVHPALTYYPHTNPTGHSAYELLYWVTDHTVPDQPRSSSATLWLHNDSSTGKAEAIEVGLGVEDGQADLKLAIMPGYSYLQGACTLIPLPRSSSHANPDSAPQSARSFFSASRP